MSNSGKPATGAFPFMPFPIPGFSPASNTPATAASAMSTGADLLKTLWGNLPGSSQVPGFLVPTLDVEELDKRITDLKAAESWVEVNLNMLRATIQGLEVQRNTIAALKAMSVSTPTENPFLQATATDESPATSTPGLAAGSWLSFMQDQFTKVAGAAMAAGVPTTGSDDAPPKAAARSGKRRTGKA